MRLVTGRKVSPLIIALSSKPSDLSDPRNLLSAAPVSVWRADFVYLSGLYDVYSSMSPALGLRDLADLLLCIHSFPTVHTYGCSSERDLGSELIWIHS